jgi:multiple sugar transport system permease protein
VATKAHASISQLVRSGFLRVNTSWLFLAPALFFFVLYQAYPILRVLGISFTDYNYLSSDTTQWIGLRNYTDALNDSLLWDGLGRAIQFTVLFLPCVIIIPLIVAILIDRVRQPWLATIYRVILIIPAVIPSALIFVLWKWMFDFQIGPINHILVDVLGISTPQTAPQWLGGTSLTMIAVVIMDIWWGLGFHPIFFLAGLAAIPKELYEAAKVDGAREWDLLRHITLPQLRPMMAVLTVLRFSTAMAVIDEFLIMGGFNRTSSTYSWTVYMYDLSFRIGQWPQGRAAAIGWIGATIMITVVAILLLYNHYMGDARADKRAVNRS